MSEDKTPARPRQITMAAVMALVGSAVLVVSLFDTLGRLRTPETRGAIDDFLAEPPGSALALETAQVVEIMRVLAYAAGALAAMVLVFAVYVLQRHRGARVGLTVAAGLLLATVPVAGLLPVFIAVAAVLLWSQPARDWYSGRKPALAGAAGPPGHQQLSGADEPPRAPGWPPPLPDQKAQSAFPSHQGQTSPGPPTAQSAQSEEQEPSEQGQEGVSYPPAAPHGHQSAPSSEEAPRPPSPPSPQNYPQPGYPQPSYPEQGYPQPGYPEQGYPQPGFGQQGFGQPGYPQPGHPPQGHGPQGYAPQSYAPPSYAPPGYPPQGYGAPGYPYGYAFPSTDKRPTTVTVAAVLTWIGSALVAGLMLLFAVILATDSDYFVDEFEAAAVDTQLGVSPDELLAAGWVVTAVVLLWTLASAVLAFFAFRRSNPARIALAISAALAALLSLLLVLSGVALVPLVLAGAALVLLFTGGANDWYARRPRGGQPGHPPYAGYPSQPPAPAEKQRPW